VDVALRDITMRDGPSWNLHLLYCQDVLVSGITLKGAAWKAKPSWYVVAKHDRTVHPDPQRFVAKRMGATTIEADSSHVPMLSQPSLVIDVIRKAAATVQASVGTPPKPAGRPSP
jgi:pimeloyl-ACP methyl ester carboxylesterase